MPIGTSFRRHASLVVVHSWSQLSVPRLPGTLPPLTLFDTASGALKAVEDTDNPRMYVCGITPYDATHLGHAATYLAFDLIYRYWVASGKEVNYVQNVTDVDDPLFERAARDGIDWRELGQAQTDLFRSDMEALRIVPPTSFIGAVEAMDEVAEAVDALLTSGAAYRVADDTYADVYFDISATGRFGYESGYDEATMLRLSAERGGDPQRAGKRHPLDPLLWQLARPGEPSWDSPMGEGRSGWHIECAVIAVNRLGAQMSIQGGGSDLIFPHHECSAAHAEALTGAHPFARHYVHSGMMELDGEKMSKSLGNLEFVSRLTADNHDPIVIRTALLDGHYRSDRPWNYDDLARAEGRLAHWRDAAQRDAAQRDAGIASDEMARRLLAAIANDLDTPAALEVLDSWAADSSLNAGPVVVVAESVLGIPLT